MKKLYLSISSRSAPWMLLIVAVLAFGLLVTNLGFYWDDWAKILVGRLYGLTAYPAYYAGDRPISAWTHMLFTPLLGESPLPWQVFNLLLRWLSAVGLWWTLNGIWPRARRQNVVAAVLFLVYPAFIQQPAAVTFHQQWLQYGLFFLSLGAMVRGLRARGDGTSRFWRWTDLALLAMVLQFSVTEYFTAVALVRPLVIWFLIPADGFAKSANRWRAWLARARQVLRIWAPYLAFLVAYCTWRLFFWKVATSDPYRADTLFEFFANPFKTLQATLLTVLVDEWHILVDGWAELLHIQIAGATPFTLFSYAVGALTGTLVVVALLRLKDSEAGPKEGRSETGNRIYPRLMRCAPTGIGATGSGGGAGAKILMGQSHEPQAEPFTPLNAVEAPAVEAPAAPSEENCEPGWGRQALLLGLAGLLLGPVPAWITGRQVVFDFHSDRYAMPAMFGAALFITVIIEWLAQRRVQRAVLAGLLVALAVGLHLRAANDYRWIWTSEQRFFWQLAWRAPGLKAPTALFLETEPFPNQGLFSTSAALNLMYPQDPGKFSTQTVNRLSYWIYTLRPRYQEAPDSFEIGLNTTFRTLHFEGQTPDSLLLFNNPERANCLWVLSARDKNNPYLPELVRDFLPIANLERIQTKPAQGTSYPPVDMIGAEPEHTWCYFFEKADLARQQQDWAQIAGLAGEVTRLGYRPDKPGSNSPYEWLPFIEGLAKAGQWSEAARLTRRAQESDGHFQGMLCELWGSELRPAASGAEAQSTLAATRTFLGCKE